MIFEVAELTKMTLAALRLATYEWYLVPYTYRTHEENFPTSKTPLLDDLSFFIGRSEKYSIVCFLPPQLKYFRNYPAMLASRRWLVYFVSE
jgi:hypothetical protein